MFRFALPALASVALFACAETPPSGGENNPPPASVESVTLAGDWQLVELRGKTPPEGVTLKFDGSNASGRGPCNSYFASYTAASDFSFSIENVGSTRLACPALSDEVVYFSQLTKATQYRHGREGDTFALLDAAGQTLVSYVRAGSAGAILDLTGDWRVTEAIIDGTLGPNPGPAGASLSFGSDRTLSGNLGCNDIAGLYEQVGTQVSFEQIAATARACFAPAPFEGPVLSALPKVMSFEQTAAGVNLLDAGGGTLLRLAR